MKIRFIKPAAVILSVALTLSAALISVNAVQTEMPVEINAKSAILVDVSSGQVLAAMNEHERLFPASVTKIMTLLLVMECTVRR